MWVNSLKYSYVESGWEGEVLAYWKADASKHKIQGQQVLMGRHPQIPQSESQFHEILSLCFLAT